MFINFMVSFCSSQVPTPLSAINTTYRGHPYKLQPIHFYETHTVKIQIYNSFNCQTITNHYYKSKWLITLSDLLNIINKQF